MEPQKTSGIDYVVVEKDITEMAKLLKFFKEIDDAYNDGEISWQTKVSLADEFYEKYEDTKYIGFIKLLYTEYIDMNLHIYTDEFDSCFEVLKCILELELERTQKEEPSIADSPVEAYIHSIYVNMPDKDLFDRLFN